MLEYQTILTAQLKQVADGSRGFISIPAFRREHECDRSTNWFRRQAEALGLEVYRHGSHGWCIGRPIVVPADRPTLVGNALWDFINGEG